WPFSESCQCSERSSKYVLASSCTRWASSRNTSAAWRQSARACPTALRSSWARRPSNACAKSSRACCNFSSASSRALVVGGLGIVALLSAEGTLWIIRNLVGACTLVVDRIHGLVIGVGLDDGEGLCPCAPDTPRSFSPLCHTTSCAENPCARALRIA